MRLELLGLSNSFAERRDLFFQPGNLVRIVGILAGKDLNLLRQPLLIRQKGFAAKSLGRRESATRPWPPLAKLFYESQSSLLDTAKELASTQAKYFEVGIIVLFFSSKCFLRSFKHLVT